MGVQGLVGKHKQTLLCCSRKSSRICRSASVKGTMSFGSSKPDAGIKKFVSETEIEEKRKIRQAEWEKVRKPDQPAECPEEPLDNRTLYDRLQEQKLKKQEEEEEARKLKNFVRGLEREEIEFLDTVDDVYMKIQKDKRAEEKRILAEFREKAVLPLPIVEDLPLKLIPISPTALKRKEPPESSITVGTTKKSQKDLLSSVIKIKRSTSEEEPKQATLPESSSAQAKIVQPKAPLIAGYGTDSDSES